MKQTFNFLLLMVVLINFSAKAQQTIIHPVPFATDAPQSMWGPNGVNVGLNQTWDIFGPWSTGWQGFSVGDIISGPFGVGDFGVEINGGIELGLGCTFSLSNFTLGQLEVDYPIDVEVITPSDLTYDQGDNIEINTSYELQDGWALDTYYPNPGSAKLTLNVTIGAALDIEACFGYCFPVVELIDLPTTTIPIDIIDLDLDVTDGDGYDASLFSIYGNALFTQDFPDTLYTEDYTSLDSYGLTGWFTPPHVYTDDDTIGLDLQACGESQYINLNLEIFDLLSNIPYLSALEYLDYTYPFDVGPITFQLHWSLFTANLAVGIVNNQCFDFQPAILGSYEFPVPIEYQLLDGPGGTPIGGPQIESVINFEVGNTIDMKYPCYFVDMDVTPTYSIDGQITSHTWDEIPVVFWYSGLAFDFSWSDYEILPPIPALPYPCGINWCSSWGVPYPCGVQICYTDPFGGLSLSDIIGTGPLTFGPYIPVDTLPIATVSYDWFAPTTWSLDGFDEYTFEDFEISASPLGVSNTFTDVDCHGESTGSIDVSFTALSEATPYTYLWTDGQTIEDLSNLPAGPYELSAYDAHGCQLFTGATIQQPNQPLTIIPSFTDISCNSGISDGTIDLLIQGGTAPYNVTWNNGSNGASISGLGIGTYIATVTDSKGCIETINVDIDQPNPLVQVAAITHVLCNSDNTGAIEIDVFGGTAPYTYGWNSGQTTQDIESLIAGGYTLILTDANGCINAVTHIVDEPATSVQLSITGVDILCKNDSTGSLDLTSVGGTPGYTYEWSNSLGLVLPFQSEDIANIPADDYTVLVTDLNGCSEQISLALSEPNEALATQPILTHINCNGDLTGMIDPLLTGGTSGYTFVWSDGSSNTTNSGLAAGNYNLTVTDANGCTYTEQYDLIEPTALALVTSFSDVLCFGENSGSATVVASGATPNYTYAWSNAGANSTIQDISTGNYTVTVTDGLGCIETASVFIDQPIAPLTVSYVVTSIDCYGNETGAVDMTPAGGTTPYNYTWATSGSVILAQSGEDIIDLQTDTYLLTLTDDHGCILNSSVFVDQPNAPLSISGTTTDVLCVGGDNGAIDISVAGGTQNYLFAWDNGTSLEDPTVLIAGSYNVVVTDVNGCQISEEYSIMEPNEALVTTIEFTDVTCFGGDDGYAISNVSGGTGQYSYDWSNGTSMENAYNLVAGTYTLTVTDENGCTAFTGGDIYEPATSVDLVYTVIDVLCFGGSDGQIEMTPINGTAPYYYNWGNQNDILLSEDGDVLSGLTMGTYLIRVIDANGCIHEEMIVVNEPTLLETSNISFDVLCFGEATGSIDATIWGGTAPYSSEWSTNDFTEDVVDISAGWYYYEVTDDHGCIVNDSAVVLQPEPLYVTSHSISHVTCVDQADGYLEIIVEGGVSPYDYLWNTGSTDDYIENLEAGWYNVIYTDNHNCTDTVYYFVEASSSSCIDIPNTISPNGDLYNDTWIIDNMHLYPNAEVAVFNKWGNELYRIEGEYIPWDGTVNGLPLPSEVYYYIILLNNDLGDKFTGTITIIR